MSTQSQKTQILINVAYWLTLAAIVYVILKYLIYLLMPFFLALIFAAISRPLAHLLSRGKGKLALNKKFVAIFSVVIIFVLLTGLIAVVAFRAVDSGITLIENMPNLYYETVQPGLERLFAKAENLAATVDDSVLAIVKDSTADIIASLGRKITEISAKFILWISNIATAIPKLLLNTIICLIATVFIAIDFDDIALFLNNTLPERALLFSMNFKDSLVDIVWQFLKSYFFIFLITTSEIIIGFLIVGQAKPVLLGMLIAAFDAFPIVGSGMILLPLSVITICSGAVGKGIGLFIVYVVVVVARQIIEPRIVGRHVGLRPLVTLICMYAGTKLFGGIGLFALPILAAIIVEMNNNGTIHLIKTMPEMQQ